MYMIRGNHEHMVVRMGSCPGTYETEIKGRGAKRNAAQ